MEDETVTALRQIFRSVDKDSSGLLSVDEIEQVMKQLRNGKQPPREEVLKCFRDMDTVCLYMKLKSTRRVFVTVMKFVGWERTN